LRIAGTGISFVSFGTGGLLLGLAVFPAIRLFVRERVARAAVARTVLRATFRCLISIMQALGVLRFEVRGLERLDRRGLLVVANHPTLIDTVFLMAFVRHADCIVKSTLWNNPFTGGPVRAAAYLSSDNGPRLVDDCIDSLRAGNNLIIFPEGTRTPASGALRFKRGAANIALRGERDLTPVVIRCTPSTLGKGDKWWRVPARRVHITFDVREDIAVQPFLEAGCDTVAARRLTATLQEFFAKEGQRHGVA
jgi:1-acyl-sn-glycerol-3-phosphate acyltransferase